MVEHTNFLCVYLLLNDILHLFLLIEKILTRAALLST